ncbi:ABC transporter ATP-binding protein [Streptomyces sulphureus]|uniref:ABC transporter ATP-binding protein n=1 Tax=Streptomyces sulphureus TaxID=47758 RepID=UPI00035F511E|nr:ATP-binding cassette domain-containing protein [Streptomyces sulphureus]
MDTPQETDAPPEDVLRASGVQYAYDGSPALQGVSLNVARGEIVVVTGPRGSGKTTLLGCLAGQLVPTAGETWFDGVAVHLLPAASRERLRSDHFGWIGSTPQLVPELTAWENAALPLLLRGTGHRTARTRALEWLERLDVGGCAHRRPPELLQVQRQRVAIVRALIHTPAVLFADEPTAPLHDTDRAQVLRTLTAAARSEQLTMVLATHDVSVATAADATGATLADRGITLADGRTPGEEEQAEPEWEGSEACSLFA